MILCIVIMGIPSEGLINYDIHFVNGDPGDKKPKLRINKEFSADEQDLLHIYMVMTLIYLALTPIQVWSLHSVSFLLL